MLITSRQKRTVLNDAVLNLQYNDIDISITTCDKILCIRVDNNLTWNTHFNFIFLNLNKAKKMYKIQNNTKQYSSELFK